MSEKALKQMERVNVLTELLEEKMQIYKEERASAKELEKKAREQCGEYCHIWHSFSVTAAEIKRLMMVLRTETIRLGKMI